VREGIRRRACTNLSSGHEKVEVLRDPDEAGPLPASRLCRSPLTLHRATALRSDPAVPSRAEARRRRAAAHTPELCPGADVLRRSRDSRRDYFELRLKLSQIYTKQSLPKSVAGQATFRDRSPNASWRSVEVGRSLLDRYKLARRGGLIGHGLSPLLSDDIGSAPSVRPLRQSRRGSSAPRGTGMAKMCHNRL
jgi:hypothetical protein